jgi:hypothetical protein
MFFKQLNKIIQNVSLASKVEVQDRRRGEPRRLMTDRRQEARVGDGLERRVIPERRLQAVRRI